MERLPPQTLASLQGVHKPMPDRPARPDDTKMAGLCSMCLHVSLIHSDRGGRFYQCRRSFTDSDYAKYPRLPVLSCNGFELESIGKKER